MTEITKQPRTQGLFLHPLLQLILSGIGLFFSLLAGVLSMIGGAFGIMEGSLSESSNVFFSTGFSAVLTGLVFLIPLVQSVQQLTGKQTHYSQKYNLRTASILMVLWAPLLLLGEWIAKNNTAVWFFLPLLQVILIASPIFFLIELARRNLTHPEGGAAGVFTLGAMLTQPLVLLAEMTCLAGIAVLVIGWVNMQPALVEEISRLGQRLMDTNLDPRMAVQIVLPYLQSPGIILAVMLIGAGIVPLIEELMKPMALWVMAGRKPDEQAGFVLGLFAGGTFALLESLSFAVSAVGQDWGSIIVARLGTGILHVTTTALMGWGLAAAWSRRKYFRLGITFLVSFMLHAIWNVLGIYLGIQQYTSADTGHLLTLSGSAALVILMAGMIFILLAANRHLKKTHQSGNGESSAISVMPAASAQPANPTDEVLENE